MSIFKIAMMISTKGRYAVKVMLDLAVYGTDDYVKLKSISDRHNISVKYLEQIVGILNKAGYVKSIRGAQGGYQLALDPSEYTVGMILRLTEGSLAPVSCLDTKDKGGSCDQCDTCDTLPLWKEIQDAVDNVVDNITIADLISK